VRGVVIAAALLLALPLGLAARRTLAGMGVDRPYDVRYLPDPKSLRFLSPGLQLTIANSYWLSTVQYIGERRPRERGMEKLFPLADLVTTLDPRHGYAYQTAGIVLSGEGRLEESDRILRAGIERGPGWWSYPLYLAFNAFFYRGDTEAAAFWAERAARTPGASTNLAGLAMTMKVRSGSPDDAVRLLLELREAAGDETTAAALAEQLKLAVLQRDFARLDAAVARYREERGRPPRALEELVQAGLLPALPEEPYGGRYYLDVSGVVHSSARDQRFKPQEPPRDPATNLPVGVKRPPAPPPLAPSPSP